ncbi:MAG: BatD family protein [Gammaproteobacteria bacterium]|nr:BatD family protein [Gammaproteobacteria bacterium]
MVAVTSRSRALSHVAPRGPSYAALRNALIALAVVGLMLATLPSTAAEVSARVDRSEITMDETFTLTIERSGAPDDAAQPELAPLESDFEVVSQQLSTSIRIINNAREDSAVWTIGLSAKQPGALTIPPISIGQDKTQAIEVVVLPAPDPNTAAAQGRAYFINVESTPASPYVQSQLTYTVKIYQRLGERLVDGRLSDPVAEDALIERLGKDLSYDLKLPAGRYRVTERRFGIFPQKSGPKTISAPTLTGRPASRFAKSRIRIKGQDLAIDVRPRPANSGDGPWLPAYALELRETWSPEAPQFVVGQPVTRSVTILGRGLSGHQLPEVPLGDEEQFTVYADQPTVESAGQAPYVLGRRIQKAALVPRAAGTLVLPAIEVHWWNVEADQLEIARLPARAIEVQPASDTQSSPTSPPAQPAATPEDAPAPIPTSAPSPSYHNPKNPWIWSTGVVTLLWLATLLLWRQPRGMQSGEERMASSKTESLKRVSTRDVVASAKSPQSLRDLVLGWARARWPSEKLGSLLAVSAKMERDEAKAAILALDRALYAPPGSDWEPERYTASLGPELVAKQDRSTTAEPALRPLYPPPQAPIRRDR